MLASRSLLLLCTIAAGPLASGHAAYARSPPLWQPYRELPYRKVVAPANEATIVPQQYVEAEPGCGIPIEALTDTQLDQLRQGYGDPLTTIVSQYDPFLDEQLTYPQTMGCAPQGTLQLLPGDVLWHSYWAGAKEPRTSGTLFKETGNDHALLDVSIGGRTSVLRKAVRDERDLWRGWELQIEGAAILRLNLDEDWDFDATDFRFGVPFILARDRLLWKFAYYHLSSHVGDEFLIRNPGFTRINFSRDVLVLGASYLPLPAWRWYAETGWAFYDDEGSDPWEFQLGLDYAQPGLTGKRGTPFVALNGHLREEVRFGGNFALQAGWLWRGRTGQVLRTGLHYYNGKSSQYEFFDQFEQQIGFGLWQEY